MFRKRPLPVRQRAETRFPIEPEELMFGTMEVGAFPEGLSFASISPLSLALEGAASGQPHPGLRCPKGQEAQPGLS